MEKVLNWTETNLADKKYFNVLGSGINYFKGLKYYYSTSSVDGSKVLGAEGEFNFFDRPSRANMQPVENSVWFAKMKNTLKVINSNSFHNKSVIFSTGFCGIACNNLSPDFFEQFFLSEEFNTQKDNLSEGSTQQAINNSKLKEIKIYIPDDINEQNKIAKILTKVDEAIENTEALIQKYEHIKVGLMQDLLTKGIDDKGNIRSEETHQFKDSPLGRIPQEWDYDTIGNNLELLTSGSRGWAKYYAEEGSKFIRITNLKRNQIEIDLSNLEFVKLPEKIEGTRSSLKFDDILISITADLGIIGYVDDIKDAYINQHIALVRFKLDKVVPKFIAYYLASDLGQKQFSFLNDGGAKAGLNLPTIRKIPIPIINKNECLQIISKFDSISDVLNNLRNKKEKFHNQKKGLMQDLLSGRVRVNY